MPAFAFSKYPRGAWGAEGPPAFFRNRGAEGRPAPAKGATP